MEMYKPDFIAVTTYTKCTPVVARRVAVIVWQIGIGGVMRQTRSSGGSVFFEIH